MLSLLLYHYDCLLFYHSFCPDSTNFCFSHAFKNVNIKFYIFSCFYRFAVLHNT